MVFGLGVGYKWIWRNGFSLEPSYNMAFFLSKLKRYEFGEGIHSITLQQVMIWICLPFMYFQSKWV